jgi:hypothetical protein
MTQEPLKKSVRVILTVAAAMGMAVRGQQSGDPCAPSSFNAQVCQVAIRHKGYCSGGGFVKMPYRQAYPYYYDSYSAFIAGGGMATAPEGCAARGGFGAHGIARNAGG